MFSLDHRIADVHDVSGNTLYRSSCSPHLNHLVVTRALFRYISSMVVHPSQRGKRLGESFVTRIIEQVELLRLCTSSAVLLQFAAGGVATAGASADSLLLLQVTAKYPNVHRALLIVNTCWAAAAAIYRKLG